MYVYAEEAVTPSVSYVWQCLTLSGECPLTAAPLRYFSLGVGALYAVLLLTAAWDARFLGGVRALQGAAQRHVAAVRRSVRTVQRSQRRLAGVRDRVDAQLRRGREGAALVAALRSAARDGRADLLRPPPAPRPLPADGPLDRDVPLTLYADAPLWHTAD